MMHKRKRTNKSKRGIFLGRYKWRLGDDLSSGIHLHNLPPDNPPHSLAKLIARDRAMSILNALANYLINGIMNDICKVYMVD
jgi:hypothetical protein